MCESLKELSIYFAIGSSIATIIALLLFMREMCTNQRRNRENNSFHLLELFFEKYDDRLIELNLPSSYAELNLWNDQYYQTLRMQVRAEKYAKQRVFLQRLAMYWRKGLVDREMIKEQLEPKIVFESFVMETLIREQNLVWAKNYLKKMSDEISRKPHRFQWLIDLLVCLGIAK